MVFTWFSHYECSFLLVICDRFRMVRHMDMINLTNSINVSFPYLIDQAQNRSYTSYTLSQCFEACSDNIKISVSNQFIYIFMFWILLWAVMKIIAVYYPQYLNYVIDYGFLISVGFLIYLLWVF